MARRRRKRGSSASSRRAGSSIWTANVINELDLLTTVTGITLLQSSQFAPFSEVTMRGIYGWLHLKPLTSGIIDDTAFLMMTKIDEDIAISGQGTLDPGDVTNLTEEDVFWTGGGIVNNISTTIGNGGVYMPIHLTNMRKVTQGQKIVLTFTNGGGAGNIMLSGMLRTYSKQTA